MLEVLPESHAEHVSNVGEPETLNELFGALAQQCGDSPALIGPNGDSTSFQRLQNKSITANRRYLVPASSRGKGLRLYCRRAWKYCSVFLSISTFGVFVPLNPDYTKSEFSYFLKATGVKSILIGEDAAEEIKQTALKALLQHYPGMQLQEGKLNWRHRMAHRWLQNLPVRVPE